MELIGEALDDALHQVLLGDVVLALHNLLHHAWKHHPLQRQDYSYEGKQDPGSIPIAEESVLFSGIAAARNLHLC